MGKPLRAQLTERFTGTRRQPSSGRPTDAFEAGIIQLCEEVLGITGISIGDNFFDLGGNSATGVEFLERIASHYSVAVLEPSILFEANSFAVIAELRLARAMNCLSRALLQSKRTAVTAMLPLKQTSTSASGVRWRRL